MRRLLLPCAAAVLFLAWAPSALAEGEGEALRTTVDDIIRDYRENEVAADRKYKASMIIVTGRIDCVARNPSGSGYCIVMRNVICHFRSYKKAMIERLRKGDEVSILGKCKGRTQSYVEVRDCTVIKLPGGSAQAPAPEASGAQEPQAGRR